MHLFLLRTFVLSSLLCAWAYADLDAQDSNFSNSNSIGMVLTGAEGHIEVASDRLEATYVPRVGYFKLRVPLETFVATHDEAIDVRLLSDFMKHRVGEYLTIVIYTEDKPLDLGQFDADGTVLPSRIRLGDITYENRARIWGRLRSENFLFGFTDYIRFDPPLTDVAGMKMPVGAIKLFSENIDIRDFTDLLN
jgi:hypothetical protein